MSIEVLGRRSTRRCISYSADWKKKLVELRSDDIGYPLEPREITAETVQRQVKNLLILALR